jgi:hypothetical protein
MHAVFLSTHPVTGCQDYTIHRWIIWTSSSTNPIVDENREKTNQARGAFFRSLVLGRRHLFAVDETLKKQGHLPCPVVRSNSAARSPRQDRGWMFGPIPFPDGEKDTPAASTPCVFRTFANAGGPSPSDFRFPECDRLMMGIRWDWWWLSASHCWIFWGAAPTNMEICLNSQHAHYSILLTTNSVHLQILPTTEDQSWWGATSYLNRAIHIQQESKLQPVTSLVELLERMTRSPTS